MFISNKLIRIAALASIAVSFAGAQTFTISGTVTTQLNPTTRVPVPGVTMTLGGGQTRTTTTNVSGQYAFTALPKDLGYTITPSSPGYHFNPFFGAVPVLVRDLTGVNFDAAPNTGSTHLILDRLQLRFGATTGGTAITGAQQVEVRLIGTAGSTTAWTATPNQPWLTVSPTSGTGTGRFTVSINQNALPGIGTTNGSIAVFAAGVTGSPQNVNVSLNTINAAATAAPIGVVDTPANGATNLYGAIGVTGWSLDDIEVVRISLWRDPIGSEPAGANGLIYIGDAVFLDGARPDVANIYSTYPLNTRGGWGVQVLTNMLPNSNGTPGTGNGTYKLSVFAHDREGKMTLLGAPIVTVNNAAATRPFGTLDTPRNGEVISGPQYTVFGWALTPQPGIIPTNGSTIAVFVDGVSLGPPNGYNQFRPDIAALFPGYANTNGAVGYFYLDTTKLANGLHSIAWSVTDNLGRIEGIGNRLFYVQN